MSLAVESGTRPDDAVATERARGLRVLAFCDYFQRSTGGGAERVALEVYRRLVAWGAQVTVVTTDGTPDPWEDGLRVVRMPSVDLTKRLGVQASLTKGAARRAGRVAAEVRPHVLHANSLQFQTSLAAARLRGRTSTPLVLTAHLGGFEALPLPLRLAATAHERTVGCYLLARSDRVIAVSDAVAEHLAGYGIDGRVRVVRNGVDHERFRPRARAASGFGGVHVLFVGRLVPNKGPGLVLEAFARLRERGVVARLTVVGDGPMRGTLMRRARELGLDDVARFAGFSDRVEDLLHDADVFVRPTLTEGLPLAVLEAMAAGVCVVASDVPGNAELVRHEETGLLFRAGDVAELTGALSRAVADGAERRRLARGAYVESLGLSWDRCALETLAVLREVAPALVGGGAP